MNKSNTNQNNFQFNSAQSRANLLEQSKLSRLPERKAFNLDAVPFPTKTPIVTATCAGCGGRLDFDDAIQNSIHGCRKCIGIYTRLDAAIDESSKRKTKELLEKFTGGAK